MLRLCQKVLSTALSQWMLNMTSNLFQVQGVCYSPCYSRSEYGLHLYSWLQQPLRDGCHQKNNFHHPSQQYSLVLFKNVTVQAHNLILLNVKLCSMFNVFTRFNSSSNPPKSSLLHNTNTNWSPAKGSGNKLLPNSATWYTLKTTPSTMLSLLEKSRTENNLLFWSVRYSKSMDNGQHWGSEVYILQCFHSLLVTMWP